MPEVPLGIYEGAAASTGRDGYAGVAAGAPAGWDGAAMRPALVSAVPSNSGFPTESASAGTFWDGDTTRRQTPSDAASWDDDTEVGSDLGHDAD
jgi:hypothetical protein